MAEKKKSNSSKSGTSAKKTQTKKSQPSKSKTEKKTTAPSRSTPDKGKKSGGGKKTEPSKKQTTASNGKSGNGKNHEWKIQKISIILFAVALVFLAATLIEGEHVWLEVRKFFFGLFGVTAFVWPVMLIYISITISLKKTLLSVRENIIGITFFTLILSGILNVFSDIPEYGGIGAQAEYIWSVRDTVLMCRGGLTGVIFGGVPYLLFGKVPAAVVLIILLVVVFMLLTRTTIMSIAQLIGRVVNKIKESRELSESDYEEDGNDEEENVYDFGNTGSSPHRTEYVPFDVDTTSGVDDGIIIDELVGNEKKKPVVPNKKQPKPFIDINTGEVITSATNASGDTEEINDIINKVKKKPSDFNTIDLNSSKASKTDSVNNTGKEKHTDNDAEVKAAFKAYEKPRADCLVYANNSDSGNYDEELKTNASKLVDTLNSFNVSTKIVGICRGPSVTRYELQPAAGVKISRITSLSDDLALALASSGVRIEAPIPNKSAVGIEVPNKNRATVSLREIVESPVYKNAKSTLNVALGRDITGNVICADIEKMPHLLIAGTTGSGKSVCLNAMIVSLLFNATPDEVKLVLIDPKKVEFTVYNGIPHLLVPVVSDPRKAAGALGWAVTEMLQRYKIFSDMGVRDIKGYNKLAATDPTVTPLPRIVIFIDELSDLMMAAPNEVEDSICRLAQMARAAGMHLVIATQRPSVNVITGLIKANIPSRIALSVSSQIDSRTILDSAGAEKLLGYGDMLFGPMGLQKPLRVQGCFLSDEEVESVVKFIKNQFDEEKKYDEEVIKEIERQASIEPKKGGSASASADDGDTDGSGDEMLPKAIEVVVEAQMASTTLLQRKLKLGYARAARIIDELEQRQIVGPFEGSKPRKVLISKQQWIEMNAMGNISAPIENPIVNEEYSDYDEDDDE